LNNLLSAYKSIILENVLVDTGCATTIFDTDLVEDIDLFIDRIHGRAVRMYGVGGHSEICFQQSVSNLKVNNYPLSDFILQLGMTRTPYGFDGILGVDFLVYTGLIIDFKNLEVGDL
jgi:hypothetical protein